MPETPDVDASLKAWVRERCLLQGCYYGLVTTSDACVYCGAPKPHAGPLMGRSPLATLTPDVDQIARAILDPILEFGEGSAVVTITPEFAEELQLRAAEQLRLVWNARGAADLTKLESELSSLMGVTAAGPYVKNLDRALRSLDR